MYRMFYRSAIKNLNLNGFDTTNVTSIGTTDMFRQSDIPVLDLSSFDTSSFSIYSDMFNSCTATVGYARTQADADKLNSMEYKPSKLTFVVK